MSGQGAVSDRKWQYEEEMSFLLPFYKKRSTLTSFNARDGDTENIEPNTSVAMDGGVNFFEESTKCTICIINKFNYMYYERGARRTSRKGYLPSQYYVYGFMSWTPAI